MFRVSIILSAVLGCLKSPIILINFSINRVHYQSGKCTFQLETENVFSLWELIPALANKTARNYIHSQTRNSSQYPSMRTGQFSIENNMSGKHLSWITDKQFFWNVCLSSINHTWMSLHNGLLSIIPKLNFANIDYPQERC